MNKRDFINKALKQVNKALAKKERIKPFVKSSHYERTVMVLELVQWGLTRLDKKLNQQAGNNTGANNDAGVKDE